MTQPPTVDQLRNLTDRAAQGLTADEQARLRAGIDQLEALQQMARGYCPACGRGDAAPTIDDWQRERRRADEAEAAVARVRALVDECEDRGHDSGHPLTVTRVRDALDGVARPEIRSPS